MSWLEFENLPMLMGCLVVPVLFLILLWSQHRRQQALRRFVSVRPGTKAKPLTLRPRWISGAFFLFGVTLAVLALARPFLGYEEREMTEKGVDIAFVVDVSPSMDVQDITPSRLQRVKFKMTDLLERLRGDRVSLIAFSGSAFTLVPLTNDQKAFRLFVDELDSSLIPNAGTNISEALRHALSGFESQKQASARAILLFSDGEDSLGISDDVLDELKKQGVLVFVLGAGTSEGGPVPDPDGGFKFGSDGHMAVSKIDETALTKLAEQTSGRYVRLSNDDSDIQKIYDEGIKVKIHDQELKSIRHKIPQYWIWPFLILSFFGFLLDSVWPNGDVRKIFRLSLFVIFFGGMSSAQADWLDTWKISPGLSENPVSQIEALDSALQNQTEDPWLNYNRGLVHFENGDYEKARHAFEKAIQSFDPKQRAMALNNLGSAYYRLNDLQKALQSFEAASEIQPKNKKYSENAEFVRQRLEQEKQEKEKQNEEQEQNKQENKQQDDKNQDQDPQQNDQEQKEPNSEDSKSSESEQNPDEKSEKEKAENSQKNDPKDSSKEEPSQKEDNQKPQNQPNEEQSNPQPTPDDKTQEQGDSAAPADQNEKTSQQVDAGEWVDSISDDPRKALDFMIRKKTSTDPKTYDKDW